MSSADVFTDDELQFLTLVLRNKVDDVADLLKIERGSGLHYCIMNLGWIYNNASLTPLIL